MGTATACGAVMARYWLDVFPRARRELRRWQRRAEGIADARVRAEAIATLRDRRLIAEGAALFDVVAPVRDPRLLPGLIALELMWDLLDALDERLPADASPHGPRLHGFVPRVLTLDAAPWESAPAGGYLAELGRRCRRTCRALPGYRLVEPSAVRLATWAVGAQSANHARTDRARHLRRWASAAMPEDEALRWHEFAAAATSASLAILALLALAADPASTAADVEATLAVYFPWVCALSTLLDSLVDEPEDRRSGDHRYLAHYASRDEAVASLHEITRRAFAGTERLRNGDRHAVIVAGMIAMYLSRSSAWTPAARPASLAVLEAGGTLTWSLLAVLRARRSTLALR